MENYRYNIVEVGNEDFVLASCPTLQLANKYLKEMYDVDKKLYYYYGWSKLPKYKIIEKVWSEIK